MRRQCYPLHHCAADHIPHSKFLVHCQFSLHYRVYILELIKNRPGLVIVLCSTRSNTAFFFCFFPLILLHLWVSCFSVWFFCSSLYSFLHLSHKSWWNEVRGFHPGPLETADLFPGWCHTESLLRAAVQCCPLLSWTENTGSFTNTSNPVSTGTLALYWQPIQTQVFSC